MSLRDYFASKEQLHELDNGITFMSPKMGEALAGEKMPEAGWSKDPIAMCKWEAKWRAALKYIRADAMLAAREKGQQ